MKTNNVNNVNISLEEYNELRDFKNEMKKGNILNISLEEYNELRDFKNQIEKGNACRINRWLADKMTNTTTYMSIDEAFNEIKGDMDSLQRKNGMYEAENNRVKNENNTLIYELKDIKSWSWWKFFKFKLGL